MFETYELRKLEAEDTFLLAEILGEIGIEEFSECFNSKTLKGLTKKKMGETDMIEIGAEAVLKASNIILRNISKCKTSIYSLLSNLSGIDEKELRKIPFNSFIDMVIQLIKKEEFGDFFTQVSKSFK